MDTEIYDDEDMYSNGQLDYDGSQPECDSEYGYDDEYYDSEYEKYKYEYEYDIYDM